MDDEGLTICPMCECVVTEYCSDDLDLYPAEDNPQYHRTCLAELARYRQIFEIIAPIFGR